MISSGVLIAPSIRGARIIPMIIIKAPESRLNATEVWTA